MASRCSFGRECSWIIPRLKQERYRRPGALERSACLLLMETIMLSPSRQFRPAKSLRRAGRTAFTLVEIVISLAVIGTLAGSCYIGFNTVNAYGVGSRLYSEAQAAAQNQI